MSPMADWIVHVSEVPALLCVNNDAAFEDALKTFWRRNHAHTFGTLVRLWPERCKTSHERATDLVAAHGVDIAALAARGAAGAWCARLDPAERKAIEDAITAYEGVRWEEVDVDRHEEEAQSAIRGRNVRTFTRALRTPDGRAVLVKGRVDGVDDDAVLVESKRRARGFRGVAPHERMQCALYMDLLCIGDCRLVETFDGAQRVHAIAADPSEVSGVHASLCGLVDTFGRHVVGACESREDAFAAMGRALRCAHRPLVR